MSDVSDDRYLYAVAAAAATVVLIVEITKRRRKKRRHRCDGCYLLGPKGHTGKGWRREEEGDRGNGKTGQEERGKGRGGVSRFPFQTPITRKRLNRVRAIDWNTFRDDRMKNNGVSGLEEEEEGAGEGAMYLDVNWLLPRKPWLQLK